MTLAGKHIYMKCLFWVLVFPISYSVAQTNIDSLVSTVKKIDNDTLKASLYENIGDNLYNQKNFTNAVKNYLSSAIYYERNKNILNLSLVYEKTANSYKNIYAYENAAGYYKKCYDLYGNMSDSVSVLRISKVLVENFIILKKNNDALEILNKLSLKNETKKNQMLTLWTLDRMAISYKGLGNYDKAVEIYNKMINIQAHSNDSVNLFRVLNNLGAVYVSLKKYNDAAQAFTLAINIGNTKNVAPKIIADMFTNLGICYQNIQEYESGITNLKKALNIYLDIKAYDNSARVENILAILFYYKNDLYNASEYSRSSIESAQKSGDKNLLQQCYNTYSQILKSGNDHTQALDYYEQHLTIHDSLALIERMNEKEQAMTVFQIETSNKEQKIELETQDLRDLELIKTKLEKEKQKQQIDLLQRENKITRLEKDQIQQLLILNKEKLNRTITEKENTNLKQQNRIKDLEILNKENANRLLNSEKEKEKIARKKVEEGRKAAIRLIILVVFIGILILIGLVMTRKKNIILGKQKAEIEDKNIHLKDLNEEILTQKELIEEKNVAITDSIRYAQRIQTAVLPPIDFLNNILNDYFILFKPRDIVSGDFYWGTQKDNKVVIAAADCTGHGVPGAFMSMLGMAFLDELVSKSQQIEANKILDQLRTSVIASLRQTGTQGETKDGMDISLCVIDFDKMILNYAGAYNPLIYIRNNELFEVKADRMPIGIHDKNDKSFTGNIIKLQKNDSFYIFSDGYFDQFGGPAGKKYKYKPFYDLLLTLQQSPMQEQQKVLDNNFEEWRKGYDQIDDVLVIGFRV